MKKYLLYFFCPLLAFFWAGGVFAADATFYLLPDGGAFVSNKTITIKALLNTGGNKVNAGEATFNFDPKSIQILKINKENSIFKLWTIEPTIDKNGIVRFGGGIPADSYNGTAGLVFTMDIKPLKAGKTAISIATSSLVLAADGQGQNLAKQKVSTNSFNFVTSQQLAKINANSLAKKLKGRILLQVESNGEAWYIYPDNEKRYYLGRPADAFQVMRNLGLGVSNKSFDSFKGKAPKSLSGKILLKVEDSGKAYYVNPVDLKMHYLGRPADAFQVMRNLGLGVANKDLDTIIPD